ncbi:glycosyltransferase domain-containing protein [Pelobium manganitolerans]|uniref:glycosyltransferase domain-containing protein n=1 Tax=Pelobium manganitolerans TaxID=1842495 RepID=UPI003FA36AE9
MDHKTRVTIKTDKQSPNNIVVYTAIFGDQVTLYPQKKYAGIDFICFSDRKHSAAGWEVRVVPNLIEGDVIRNNRYYKILPHLHLKEYDYSVYIDGNFLVLSSPISLVRQLTDVHMLAFDHAQTKKDPRDCIYEEYAAILKLYQEKAVLKDDLNVIKKQIEGYQLEKYPVKNGLIKGGVLIRKHHEPDVIKAMNAWWEFVLKQSKRDQLSFNYVAWKHNFKFAYINGDIRRGNPWFYMVSKSDKNLKLSLLKFKLRNLFK